MKKASKNEPLVSIVIPVYNVEPYLKRCLDSVANQTYNNLEMILVNDGSTDKSQIICEEFVKKDKRFKLKCQKNGGLSAARNTGIKLVHGDFVTFIDSDDWVEKEYIETLYKNLISNNCEVSMVKQFVDYPKKTIKATTGKTYLLNPEECLKMMLYGNDADVSAWGKLYKIELLKSFSFPEGKNFEDSGSTYQLIDKAKRIYLDSVPLYHYIIRDNSITTNKQFKKSDMDLIEMTEEMTDYVKKKYPELENACERRIMYAHLSVFRKYAIANNKTDFVEDAETIFKYIKNNKSAVLKDKNIPSRDRFALRLAISKHIFINVINLYEKIR